MFKKSNLNINEIKLWDENARFPDNYTTSTEKDLINYFISKPVYEIEPFCEEIVNDFNLPQLEKIVIWQDGKNLIALEGNRRLTCYKLLSNPELAKDKNNRLYKKLIELKEKISISDSYELECVISSDKNLCYRFLDRKHNKKNNEVNWGEVERSNYQVRRGSKNANLIIKSALSNYLKELDIPEEKVSQVLGKGFVTTFFRLLTTGPAKNIFGLEIKKDGKLSFEDSDFPEKIKVIIHNVLAKKDFEGKNVDSRSLNKNEEIQNYLRSVKKADAKKVEEEFSLFKKPDLFSPKHSKNTQKKSNTKSNTKSKIQIIPKSVLRRTLIPKNCRIRIKQSKINNIYRELRDDLVLSDGHDAVPNAVGVLFRVFLEISLDHYAHNQNGHIFPKDSTISKKIPWVVNSLKTKGYSAKTFNNINQVSSAPTNKSYLSIHKFHEYVHSSVVQPTSSELKLKWDNLQPFFELLWGDINQ